MPVPYRPLTHIAIACAAAILADALLATSAWAIEEPADEMPALKACEEKICTMLLEKRSQGDDLSCKISKTWARTSIKGSETKGVSWGFGDAQCAVDVALARSDAVAAVTRRAHTIVSPPVTVSCLIERSDGIHRVTATATPKLVFKNGKADKVWINLKEVEGPDDIKGTISIAANLEDSLGIFHKSLIKQINKFIYKKCPKNYGPNAVAKGKEKEKIKAKQAAKAKKKPPPGAKAPAGPAAAAGKPPDASPAAVGAATAAPARAPTSPQTAPAPAPSPPSAEEAATTTPAPAPTSPQAAPVQSPPEAAKPKDQAATAP